MANKYNWVDDPCISGKSPCDTDVLNENLMHIKYDVTDEIKKKADDAINEVANAVAVQRIYDCGISTDTKGFEIISRLAHSTFDKSKFTIKGSPIITDDGIASNFTNSNYAETIPVSKISLNTFMITCDFKWTGNQGTIFSSVRGGSTEYGIALIINANKLGFYSSSNGTEWNVANLKTGSTSLVSKNIYKVSVIFTGTQYICMLLNKNTGALTTEFTIDSTDKVFAGLNMINFGGNSYWKPLNGSIDLKSIAIWSGGIPVFNGNKTGLYIAKPDNYEKIGDVVVSEDGVASGLSNSNYIKMPNQNWGTENCIEYEFTVTQDMLDNLVGRTDPWILWSTGKGYFVSQYYSKQARFATYYKLTDNSQVNVIVNIDEALKLGDCVKVINKVIAGNQLYLKVTVNGRDYLNTKSVSDNVTYIKDDIKIAGYTNYPYYGSMNLNSVKFYVDGNLVYQPCLKIPYTETFEHPNVVDVAYRNRVQDLYEQTGEALFYTIDEQNQNFTLPSGDIYGMITKNREILDIVYPIGRPMPEENNVLLDNEVWLEGATVNIVDYPKLFKVYGTKYGGDGTTTFKLPDLRNRVLWGSPDGSNGYIESKLPNIKGNVHLEGDGGSRAKQTSTASGAFNWINPGTGASFENTGGGQPWFSDFNFDASRSNSIYSDSAKIVQPPAFKVRWKTRFE